MERFVSDLKKIRAQARMHMEAGAVTDAYLADRKQVIAVLNDVLATEMVCVLRYKRHFFMARGINAESVKIEFLKHAKEEQQHCDWIAERIVQLNGEPNFNPEGLAARSHSEYQEGSSLIEMIKEELDRRAHRGRILFGNRALAWRGRFDDAAIDGSDPQDRGRTRRRPGQPANQGRELAAIRHAWARMPQTGRQGNEPLSDLPAGRV